MLPLMSIANVPVLYLTSGPTLAFLLLIVFSKHRSVMINSYRRVGLATSACLIIALAVDMSWYAAVIVFAAGGVPLIVGAWEKGLRQGVETLSFFLLAGLLSFSGFVSLNGMKQMVTMWAAKCSANDSHVKTIRSDITDLYDVYRQGDSSILTTRYGLVITRDGCGKSEDIRLPGYVERGLMVSRRLFYAGDFAENTIHYFNLDQHEQQSEKTSKGMYTDALAFRGKYYFLSEKRTLTVAGNADEVREYHLKYNSGYALGANDRRSEIYYSTWATGVLSSLDAYSLKHIRAKRFNTFIFGMATSVRDDAILLALPMKSKIAVVDAATLKTMRYLDAPRGVRDIQFEETEGKVYSAGYFDGMYAVTDYRTGKIIENRYVGTVARGVYHDNVTGRNFAVSKCGLAEIRFIR